MDTTINVVITTPEDIEATINTEHNLTAAMAQNTVTVNPGVDDVIVDGESVVTDRIANITMPEVPTKTSDLTNDSGFITSSALNGYATQTWVEGKGYLTEHQSLANYPTKTEMQSTVHNWHDPEKQNSLTAGTGITIEDDVISADIGDAVKGVLVDGVNVVDDTHVARVSLTSKQNVISDLDAIRAGANKGQSAVQPDDLSNYATHTWVQSQGYVSQSALNNYSTHAETQATVEAWHDVTKQNVLNDLDDIRSGAAKGETSVQPSQIEDMASKTWVNAQGFVNEESLQSYATKQWVEDKNYQEHLTAGEHITIQNNVISVDGDLGKVDDVKVNGTSVVSNKVANVTVPTKTSDITNDSGFITNTVSNLTNYRTASAQDAIDLGITNSIGTINAKIPSAATSENQLADKAFVNSSISTETATFRGTSAQGLTEAQFLTWANSLTKTNNDYVFWDTTDSDGNRIFKRYKYNGTSWLYEYSLNNSSFTSTQWAAINSGITASLVTDIGNNTSARHTHSNKSVLDTIDSAKTQSWDSKSTVNVSATGSSTNKVTYITVNGTEYKMADEPTEDTVHLAHKLETYVNIGKITGASQTNPITVAEAGSSLKQVFNAILGTEEDIDPTISSTTTVSKAESGTGNVSGKEIGASVSSTTATYTFTVTNSETAQYGLQTQSYDTHEKKVVKNTVFTYPIKTCSVTIDGVAYSYNIRVELNSAYHSIISATTGTIVKSNGNYIYCNVDSSTQKLVLSAALPSTTFQTASQTRCSTLKAYVEFNDATYQNELVTGFYTYLGVISTSSSIESRKKKSAITSATTGSCTVSAGSYYTYYKVTNDTTSSSTGWTAVGSTSITDIVVVASAGQYIWFASTQNKTAIYEWNDVSGKYNTDPTATTKLSSQTIHTTPGLDVNTYYTYRTTSARSGATNKKFKLA